MSTIWPVLAAEQGFQRPPGYGLVDIQFEIDAVLAPQTSFVMCAILD